MMAESGFQPDSAERPSEATQTSAPALARGTG
jgi:hypothetical protein